MAIAISAGRMSIRALACFAAIGEPLEHEDPSDRLLDVESQLGWLRELGFDDVDCRERDSAPGDRRLRGFVVIAAVGLVLAGFQFTAADTVGDVPAAVTQTLSALHEDFFSCSTGASSSRSSPPLRRR